MKKVNSDMNFTTFDDPDIIGSMVEIIELDFPEDILLKFENIGVYLGQRVQLQTYTKYTSSKKQVKKTQNSSDQPALLCCQHKVSKTKLWNHDQNEWLPHEFATYVSVPVDRTDLDVQPKSVTNNLSMNVPCLQVHVEETIYKQTSKKRRRQSNIVLFLVNGVEYGMRRRDAVKIKVKKVVD
ncbi:hypothetical protein [Ureaplasma ceti]|uniref:Uncharacterized protein n=1 Tax=Ureaplasma ceti TaxID=3119530 RepID=A0ABP9UA49_9BACT